MSVLDLNGGNKKFEERFKDINEAYNVLSNSATKRRYDRTWYTHVGRKNKISAKKEKEPVCFIPSENAPKKIRYPPTRRMVCMLSEMEAERRSERESAVWEGKYVWCFLGELL